VGYMSDWIMSNEKTRESFLVVIYFVHEEKTEGEFLRIVESVFKGIANLALLLAVRSQKRMSLFLNVLMSDNYIVSHPSERTLPRWMWTSLGIRMRSCVTAMSCTWIRTAI
jgi:hypothetical protein